MSFTIVRQTFVSDDTFPVSHSDTFHLDHHSRLRPDRDYPGHSTFDGQGRTKGVYRLWLHSCSPCSPCDR